MRPELERLQEVFAHVRYTGTKHTECLLLEPDPNAKIQRIEICSNVNHRDWFLVHPDSDRTCPHSRCKQKCSVNSPHFVIGSGFYHQVCDGIFVMQDAQGMTVLYFDLKSKSSSGVSTQFKSMKCLVRYALSLIDNTLPLSERAYCFKCIKSKLNPSDKFMKNQGLTNALGVPVFDVRVDDKQKIRLAEFLQ